MKNRILTKLSGAVNCIALLLVIQTANSTCTWIFHQPEFPERANKFKKVK